MIKFTGEELDFILYLVNCKENMQCGQYRPRHLEKSIIKKIMDGIKK